MSQPSSRFELNLAEEMSRAIDLAMSTPPPRFVMTTTPPRPKPPPPPADATADATADDLPTRPSKDTGGSRPIVSFDPRPVTVFGTHRIQSSVPSPDAVETLSDAVETLSDAVETLSDAAAAIDVAPPPSWIIRNMQRQFQALYPNTPTPNDTLTLTKLLLYNKRTYTPRMPKQTPMQVFRNRMRNGFASIAQKSPPSTRPSSTSTSSPQPPSLSTSTQSAPRRRGRPPKIPKQPTTPPSPSESEDVPASESADVPASESAPRRRGRPPKIPKQPTTQPSPPSSRPSIMGL